MMVLPPFLASPSFICRRAAAWIDEHAQSTAIAATGPACGGAVVPNHPRAVQQHEVHIARKDLAPLACFSMSSSSSCTLSCPGSMAASYCSAMGHAHAVGMAHRVSGGSEAAKIAVFHSTGRGPRHHLAPSCSREQPIGVLTRSAWPLAALAAPPARSHLSQELPLALPLRRPLLVLRVSIVRQSRASEDARGHCDGCRSIPRHDCPCAANSSRTNVGAEMNGGRLFAVLRSVIQGRQLPPGVPSAATCRRCRRGCGPAGSWGWVGPRGLQRRAARRVVLGRAMHGMMADGGGGELVLRWSELHRRQAPPGMATTLGAREVAPDALHRSQPTYLHDTVVAAMAASAPRLDPSAAAYTCRITAGFRAVERLRCGCTHSAC